MIYLVSNLGLNLACYFITPDDAQARPRVVVNFGIIGAM
jgi:hypothetical protein